MAARRQHGGWLRHLALPLILVLVVVGIAGGSYLALERYGSPAHVGTCTARGLGTSHRYTADRVENAALISAVAVDRGLPPRAASIALATAYQESQLRNIDYGDRDSVGLFQQRPSQGWGSVEQIMDPVYSTNAFYDALVKIPRYASDDINDVAQKVQRSGYPEAYRDHETEGRLFASALTGQSGPNLTCSLDAPGAAASPAPLRADLEKQFPRSIQAGRLSASLQDVNAAAGDAPDGAGATALVIDPHGSAERGWSVANWAVAQAGHRGIIRVRYQGRVWNRADATAESWGTADGGESERVVVILAGG